ncbi:MAG: SDR family NAD(P)-dependent oxidoreductase, partial [Pseudomonadales bacterium]
MESINGKRIAITGSSRGLGAAFAKALASAGAKVVINGTNPEPLAATEASIRESGGAVTAVAGSIAERDTCDALIEACVASYGGIDVLINNAGIVRDRTLFKMSDEDFDEVIAVHLRGSFMASRQAALAMRETGGGHIIHVISASGLSGGFGQGNYAAAKAGMMGMLRTWNLELARSNIRCNAFWPVADTDMTQVVFERAGQAAASKNRPAPAPSDLGFGHPDEVAVGMQWLVSDQASHLNGQCLSFNGRKIAIWTHPKEVGVGFRDEP